MSLLKKITVTLFGKAQEEKPDAPQMLLPRLKESLKNAQVDLAKVQVNYREKERFALELEKRFQERAKDPNITQAQLEHEEFALNSAKRDVDKLHRAWKRYSQSVEQLKVTIEGLEEATEMPPLLSTEQVIGIERELLMRRQECEEISHTVENLGNTIAGDYVSGSSMRKVNEPTSKQEKTEADKQPPPTLRPGSDRLENNI